MHTPPTHTHSRIPHALHTPSLPHRKGGGISETGNFAVSKKSQYQLKLKATVHEITDWQLQENKPVFIVFEVPTCKGYDPYCHPQFSNSLALSSCRFTWACSQMTFPKFRSGSRIRVCTCTCSLVKHKLLESMLPWLPVKSTCRCINFVRFLVMVSGLESILPLNCHYNCPCIV